LSTNRKRKPKWRRCVAASIAVGPSAILTGSRTRPSDWGWNGRFGPVEDRRNNRRLATVTGGCLLFFLLYSPNLVAVSFSRRLFPPNRGRHHGSTAPPPERRPRQEPLGRNGPPAFTLCHRASGPFRTPFALPSQWIQGKEVEMTVQCQNRANCAGVYHCEIRTYDKRMRGSNGGIDG